MRGGHPAGPDSRREARIRDGELVTLEEQDRALWDHAEISGRLQLVEAALRAGAVGPYQLQAAIAAVHAEARTPEETDWGQISALYARLREFQDTPVVALNHAVAVAMSSGLEEGLRQIDALGASGLLDGYYLFHAARADLLRRSRRLEEASRACERALDLATNPVERAFLKRRLAAIAAPH